jgi:hypothetical protein
MWTRWSRSGPTQSIVTKAPWYFIGAIDTASYKGAPQAGQNALSAWLGQGYYQFRGYNAASNVAVNVNYGVKQLDAVWNFVYVGYSKNADGGKITAWVQFGDGTVATQSVAAVENFVQSYLQFRVQRDPAYSGQDLLFNGYITQIIFATGKGSYLTTQAQLQGLVQKYVPLPLEANFPAVQRISINLLAETATHWCGTTCPDGYAESTQNNKRVCAPCNSQCKSCYYQDADKCSACNAPTFLYQGQCVVSCPAELYGSLLNRICVEACPPGTFADLSSTTSDRDCVACFDYCQTCTGPNNNQCQSCQDGYNLQGSSCSDKCPTGQYLKGTACLACPSTCSACSTPTVCSACAKGSFLGGSTCAASCDDGYYGDTTSNACLPCDKLCSKCTGPRSDQCVACSNGLVLVGTMC